MEKSSKITQVLPQPDKEWNGKILRKNQLTFENGEGGMHTTWPENNPQQVGETLTYELEDRGYGQEIKVPKKSGGRFGGGGRAEDPAKNKSIQRQTALKEAVNFVALLDQKHRTTDAVCAIADKFAGWLAPENKAKEAPAVTETVAPVQPNLQAVPVTPQAEPESGDLPFY